MKTNLLLFAFGLLSVFSFAQPPQAFNYQVVVRDNSGEILQNQEVGIRISIRTSSSGGAVVYQETFIATTNQFGLINLEIGTGTPTSWPFESINWAYYPKFIETEIDPEGGTNYVSMGTSELLSVPYALFAEEAAVAEDDDWITSGDDISAGNSGNVGIGTSNPSYKLQVSATEGTAIYGTSPDLYGIIGKTSGSGVAGVLGRGENPDSWGVYAYCPNGGTALHAYSNGGWSGFFNGDVHVTGNVGVGANNPAAKLEVSGDLLIRSGLKGIKLRANGSMVDIESQFTDLALNYQTGHNTVLNVTSGEVGIGTSTPNAKLHVNDRIRIGEDPSYPSVYGELIHEGSNTGFRMNAHSGGSWAYMLFQTDGNTRMAIKSNGRVGIGTTDPIARLSVQTSSSEMAVYASSLSGTGVNASSGTGYGLFAVSQWWAGYFSGDVHVGGTLSKGAGSFVIDHPLDPENKLLRHNFVESPENLLIYRGKAELNSKGEAIVEMPEYFTALTKENEATIQITPIGKPQSDKRYEFSYDWSERFEHFIIFGEPGRQISWMVLADRDDPVIHELGRPVEEEKGPDNKLCDKGKLLYPKAFGYPESAGRDFEMKQINKQ